MDDDPYESINKVNPLLAICLKKLLDRASQLPPDKAAALAARLEAALGGEVVAQSPCLPAPSVQVRLH